MIKGKLINFEFLIDTEEDIVPTIMFRLGEKFKEFSLAGVDTVFGLYPMEGILPWDQEHCVQYFNQIKELGDQNNLKIILISGLGEAFKQITVPFEYYFSPYMLRLVFNNYNHFNINHSYNSVPNKFLFLGGVPTRNNRILLLSKLYDDKLLDHAVWSFFYPNKKEDQILCRNFLLHYSDAEYESFLKNTLKSIDQTYVEVIKYFRDSDVSDESLNWGDIKHCDFWKNPIYIDPEVFKNTSFSIISEGPNFWSSDYNYITEKTWRTILYKHPFVFAGHPDQFRYLKKLGFKTFEEYLPIKDYAFIEDEEARLDAIVKNVEYWISNPEIRAQLIDDVSHNFELLLSYAKKQDLFLTDIKERYSIDQSEFNQHFNTLGFENTATDISYYD